MCNPSSDSEGLEHIESTGECIRSVEEKVGRKLSCKERGAVWWMYGLGDLPEPLMLPSARKLSFKSWLALEKKKERR